MCAACCVCLLNIFVYAKSYLFILFSISPMEVTDKQRSLLSISDNDMGFKSPSPNKSSSLLKAEKSPTLSELYNATIYSPQSLSNTSGLSSPFKSWYGQSIFSTSETCSSPSCLCHYPSVSPNFNISHGSMSNCSSNCSCSWTYCRHSSLLDGSYNLIGSPHSQNLSSSFLSDSALNLSTHSCSSSPSGYANKSLNLSPQSSTYKSHLFHTGSVTTKEELQAYLSEYKEKEWKAHLVMNNKNGNGSNSPIWSFGGGVNLEQEFLNGLKKNVYQPALKDSGPEAASLRTTNEDSITNPSTTSVCKIWVKRNVTQKQLFQYEENLRIWISMNILQPIVNMIDVCNETLSATAPELQIGDVGIDKLKKAAINISGVKQLTNLLPFLDLTLHQDYLIQRLRELSRGGAISAYKWNAGGAFNGKPWRDELPTDTFILLHLFALYMDAHLPPDPTQADGRVFSNLHLVKTPEKPQNPSSHPSLYLCQINPPHLKVVLPGEEESDVGSGHKNFLHSLLLFCHHLVHQEHSHIAGVDLRLSGINLAWVLNAD